jgi:hypothetical protein
MSTRTFVTHNLLCRLYLCDRNKWSQGDWEVHVKRRLAVLAVGTALAFGSTMGMALATDCDPPPPPTHCNNGVGNGPDCRPGLAHFNNDDNPTVGLGVPGDPGSMKGGRGGVNAY